jgi:hypothetical protein
MILLSMAPRIMLTRILQSKIKMADGSIVIDEERAAKKAKQLSNSLDGKLLSFLDTMASQVTVSEEQRRANLSEVALRQLQQYIIFHGHCLKKRSFSKHSALLRALDHHLSFKRQSRIWGV